jgi:hypothetical protein
MDDETYFTVQVKGTAYRFRPFETAELTKIQTLSLMGAHAQMIKAAMDMVSASVGPAQWDALVGRVSAGELVLEDIVGAMKRVADRQGKQEKRTPGSKGLDVASATLVPSDLSSESV